MTIEVLPLQREDLQDLAHSGALGGTVVNVPLFQLVVFADGHIDLPLGKDVLRGQDGARRHVPAIEAEQLVSSEGARPQSSFSASAACTAAQRAGAKDSTAWVAGAALFS